MTWFSVSSFVVYNAWVLRAINDEPIIIEKTPWLRLQVCNTSSCILHYSKTSQKARSVLAQSRSVKRDNNAWRHIYVLCCKAVASGYCVHNPRKLESLSSTCLPGHKRDVGKMLYVSQDKFSVDLFSDLFITCRHGGNIRSIEPSHWLVILPV